MVPTLRKELRVPVSGTITYSFGLATYTGTVRNVSIHGCQVESAQPPPLDTLVSYQMQLSEIDGPLEVKLALVQWVSQNEFGLKTLEMHPDTLKRLRRFLDDSYLQMARARRGRTAAQPGVEAGAGTATAQAATVLCDGPLGDPGQPPSTNRLVAGAEAVICPAELSAFVGWILDARRAFRDGTPLPAPPALAFKEFDACTQFIQSLLDQTRRAEPQHEPQAMTACVAPLHEAGRDRNMTGAGTTGQAAPDRPAVPRRRRRPRPQEDAPQETATVPWSGRQLDEMVHTAARSLRDQVSALLPSSLRTRLRLPMWPFGLRR